MNKQALKYKERHEFKKIFGFDAPMCPTSVATGMFHLDIFKLENKIEGYDGNKCTYLGKPDYSLGMAINEKYGDKASKLVESLL